MSDDQHIQKQLNELKQMLTNKQASVEDQVEKSNKFIRWFQGLAAICVMLITLGINWGMTTARLDIIENNLETQKTSFTNKIQQIENDVLELQLKQAGDDQILQTIQGDLLEIKTDVKELVKQRGE